MKLLHILKWFHKVSGLGINKEKKQSRYNRGLKRQEHYLGRKVWFERTTSFDLLGISYNIKGMDSITDLNINKKNGRYQNAMQHLAVTKKKQSRYNRGLKRQEHYLGRKVWFEWTTSFDILGISYNIKGIVSQI